MRAAGRLAAAALAYGGGLVAAGVTTDEIDRAVHRWAVLYSCAGVLYTCLTLQSHYGRQLELWWC